MMVSTQEQLSRLRLQGISESFDRRAQQAREDALSHEEWFSLLLGDEIECREGQNLQRRIKKAKFEEVQTFEGFDFSRYPEKIGHLIKDLRCGNYLTHHHHIAIFGPTGTGKSRLAQSLGHQACRQGKQVRFVRSSTLFRELTASRADNTWQHCLKSYCIPDLLIIDDFGLKALSLGESEDLYELIAERHLHKSFIFTSNRKSEHWLELFPEAALGNAILDRLVNKSYSIILEGDSYRRKQWQQFQSNSLPTEVLDTNTSPQESEAAPKVVQKSSNTGNLQQKGGKR